MTIQQNIRALRLKNRLSQERLGEILGVSGQAVSKWEQEISSPDISLLPAISECFGVTIDSLFQGTAARRYPGYGNERNELLAIYTSEEGTQADFDRAEEAFRERILRGIATTEDYLNYGNLHRVRAYRDLETALRYIRMAISEGNDRRDMTWMAAHQSITNLLESLGKIQEAVAEHRKWCEAEPQCAWAYVSYAYALSRAGDLSQACDAISKALCLDAEDVNVQTAAGDLFAQAGRCDEAIVHWDKAFSLDPTCISCKFSKAEMYAANGENALAIQEFEGILVWLKQNGYNMQLEGEHPRRRIQQLRVQQE